MHVSKTVRFGTIVLFVGIACLVIFDARISNIKSTSFAQINPVQKRSDVALDHAIRGFQKGRALMLKAGLPFEPNELLDYKNRRQVIAKLDRLPEFKNSEVVGRTLEGVKIADTLYLPEKIDLVGDTVLVTRSAIFEGQKIEIKGPYDLTIIPYDQFGALGTSLEEAIEKQSSMYVKTSFRKSDPPPFAKSGLTVISDASFVIDLHGLGRKECLRKRENPFNNRLAQLQLGVFRYANFSIPSQTACQPGTIGSAGQAGGTGDTGSDGLDRDTGTPGVCNGNINGGSGESGTDGGIGGEGPIGGTGGIGTPGGSCNLFVPDSNPTGNYTINTYGGEGGPGGPGGTGGTGGTGGDGGDGGDGASCACNVGLGTGGNGGRGGDGGKGGKGGKGGTGGNGGNGGAITVSLPYNYSGTVTPNYGAGPGGHPGLAGTQGLPGVFGRKGQGGDGGTNISCSPSGANDGNDGNDGSDNGYGGGGDAGTPGQPGQPGSYSESYRDAPPPDCPNAPCEEWNGTKCVWTAPAECGSPQAGCGCSPVVIDMAGNGFDLTNAAQGVPFDLNGDGVISSRLAWTQPNSDDAWLTLDRNNNGTIESGQELFGNFSPQPPSNERNGFLALAVFDGPQQGGNNDGRINSQDSVFSHLRLWQDINHNGVSEANELSPLLTLGLARIDLDYHQSRRRDQHGNYFKYRAKVRDIQGAQAGRWAWDVFVKAEDLNQVSSVFILDQRTFYPFKSSCPYN